MESTLLIPSFRLNGTMFVTTKLGAEAMFHVQSNAPSTGSMTTVSALSISVFKLNGTLFVTTKLSGEGMLHA